MTLSLLIKQEGEERYEFLIRPSYNRSSYTNPRSLGSNVTKSESGVGGLEGEESPKRKETGTEMGVSVGEDLRSRGGWGDIHGRVVIEMLDGLGLLTRQREEWSWSQMDVE